MDGSYLVSSLNFAGKIFDVFYITKQFRTTLRKKIFVLWNLNRFLSSASCPSPLKSLFREFKYLSFTLKGFKNPIKPLVEAVRIFTFFFHFLSHLNQSIHKSGCLVTKQFNGQTE